MAQITIYLPDDMEAKVRKAAKGKGTTVSRWIADHVAHDLEDAWPKGVLDAAGAISDFPALEDIRKGYGRDAQRESME